jgi:signal transduction histidine kinase
VSRFLLAPCRCTVDFRREKVAWLAYRAFEASRAQQETSEFTLREYAAFAAFQLKNATLARIGGQHRQSFELVARSITERGPTPPLGVERVAELVKLKGPQCRCLDGVSFYYQVTFADSGIEATASELATAENLRRIRDTVIAEARSPRREEPPLPNVTGTRAPAAPSTRLNLVTIFTEIGERPYVLTHAVAIDTTRGPIVAYGLAMPTGQAVGRVVEMVLENQPILPSTLAREMDVDSLLAVTVKTPSGEVVYGSNTPVRTYYAATDSAETRFGNLHFKVAIHPSAASKLIIGGVPGSRLPEVLATAFVAVCLLGLLLYQFRRQEELGRLRDDFVSGVSHELRTPLAQIRLLAELLRLGKVPTEQQRERSLRIIDQEARRLSFLVDSILRFTNTKRRDVSPVRTDVANEIEEIVSGFVPLAQAHGARLTMGLEPGIVADVDRGAIRQVLLNLLDNAVRYGPQGQNVTITTTSAGDTWTLEVADEGPGVPADERERIFAPYYRMKRDAGGAVGGTGIGLAVVQGLVKEHGGRVHVVNANGNGAGGARFVVVLPIAAPGVNGR